MSDWSKYGIHKGLFLWPGIWVSLAWFVFGIEQVFHFDWGKYGVLPGNIQHWYGVLTLPWLHGDVNHIISNTISLFFVGSLVLYSFPKLFDKIWLLSWIVPGIALWFIGRPNYHIGASAWLYALVSFVFFSGIIRMHTRLLAQSIYSENIKSWSVVNYKNITIALDIDLDNILKEIGRIRDFNSQNQNFRKKIKLSI